MDDSTLKTLRIISKKNEGLLITPAFNPNIKEYSLVVGSDVDGVQISASPNEPDAFVQVQKSGSNGIVSVCEGTSDILIKCDAADGSSTITTIHIFRPSASDATLKEFRIQTGILSPDFHRLETRYNLTVEPHLEEISISAVAMNSSSKIERVGLNEKDIVPLSLNEIEVSFKVTSADGSGMQTYVIAIQKGACGSRLIASKDSIIEKQDICSICTCITYLPRLKTDASQCTHNFCLPCLNLFSKPTLSEKQVIPTYSCPVCFTSADSCKFSILSNAAQEARLSTLKFICPFLEFGCKESALTLSKMRIHITTCTFEPPKITCSNCKDCKKISIGRPMEGEAHKEVCTQQCTVCTKRIASSDKQFHDIFWCASKRQLLPKTDLPDPSIWETDLVDKKSLPQTVEGCLKLAENFKEVYLLSLSKSWQTSILTKGANPVQPDLNTLEKLTRLYASAINLNTESKKFKNGALDETLHLWLGQFLEESVFVKATFPPPEQKGGKAVKSNDNEAANFSFMNDEVEGLLMSLGIAKNASDATKVKAMEEEFHRLTAAGLSDQAAEVQGLHQWKVQQMRIPSENDAATFAKSIRGKGGIANALDKYEHAVLINPLNSDANYNLGRLNLYLGNFEKAQLHFEHAIANRPIYPQAATLLAASILSVQSPNPELIPFALQKLEYALLDIQVTSWHSFKSKALNEPQTPTTQGMLCQQFETLSNPVIYSKLFYACAIGHLLQGNPLKAVHILSNLLFSLPNAMQTIPPRSQAFQQLGLEICNSRRLLLHAFALVSPTIDTNVTFFDAVNFETLSNVANLLILPNMNMARNTENPSETTTSSIIPSVFEQVAQSLLFKAQKSQTPLLTFLNSLGNSQLMQLDTNPIFVHNHGKLNEAIITFEAAIASEAGNLDSGLKRVEQAEWYANLKAQVEVWINAIKAKEAKASTTAKTTAGKKAALLAPAANKKEAKAPPAKSLGNANSTAPKAAKGLVDKKSVVVQKIQGKEPAGKPSRPTSAKNSATKASATKLASAKTSIASLAVIPNPALISFDAHFGLARALSRKLGFLEDANSDTAKNAEALTSILETVVAEYKNAIKISPNAHDAYIELGALLERKMGIRAAADLYASFPFPKPGESKVSQDDLYLFTELGRCFMKEKRYKELLLMDCLIAEGRATGMSSLAKYVEALDAAGESKMLMQVYAGVNNKPVNHPDLIPFFKSKFWL